MVATSRDVRVQNILAHYLLFLHHTQTLVLDQSSEQNTIATLASLHSHIFVREYIEQDVRTAFTSSPQPPSEQGLRGFHPPASVQFACAKETRSMPRAKSVKLSALVGAGGLWYGFGKIIMQLSVFPVASLTRFRELNTSTTFMQPRRCASQ